MLPLNATSWAKVETIRRYIYQVGAWNDGRAFSYDHDDPHGFDVRNKLLSDYVPDYRCGFTIDCIQFWRPPSILPVVNPVSYSSVCFLAAREILSFAFALALTIASATPYV